MPTTINGTTQPTTQEPQSLWQRLGGLLNTGQSVLENGIKTDVSVTFPAHVYFNMFALAVFITLGIIAINRVSKVLIK